MPFWAWRFGEFAVLETDFEQINYIYTFLDRNVAVRINWKQVLAFVPITNDGNIYFGKGIYFWYINFQYWCNNGSKNASPKWDPIQYPILQRNIANCGMKQYASESQRSQLSNASKMRSQLALEASVEAHLRMKILNNFPDPEKCLKRSRTCIFRKAVSNRMFSGA